MVKTARDPGDSCYRVVDFTHSMIPALIMVIAKAAMNSVMRSSNQLIRIEYQRELSQTRMNIH